MQIMSMFNPILWQNNISKGRIRLGFSFNKKEEENENKETKRTDQSIQQI
jgi:hypothetical protein